MYPPLTGTEYSPGIRTDFWLLGIGFIEISAIAGAIEIVVGILRTRPPGMTLARMPIYVWAMLVIGGMIIFALSARDRRDGVAGARTRFRLAVLHRRARAATRCCGSTCSGCSGIPTSTSSSCPRQGSFR